MPTAAPTADSTPPPPTAVSSLDRIVAVWIAWRWPLLALAVLLSLLSWPYASRLEFDRSVENMFAADDPLLPPFQQLKRTFGGDQIVLVAYRDPDLLTDAGLDRLQVLSDQLAQVPGVEAVISINDSLIGEALAAGVGESMLLFFEGLAIGADRETTAVLCFLEPEPVAAKKNISRRATVDALRQVALAHDASAVVAGEPVMVVDGFRYLEQDGQLLGWATTALLMAVILLFFRSLRWMLIPVVVVQSTLLWTQALLVVTHFRLSMVSSMLTAIVTVVGIATVVHIILRFREERDRGLDPRAALAQTAILLLSPVFWACFTDGVGFASLGMSRVGPVQSFGLMMTVGAMLTFVAVVLLLPGLVLAGRRDSDPKQGWGEASMGAALLHLADSLYRRPWQWITVSAVVILVSAAGYWRLEVETDFTKNFRAGTPVVTSYAFIEERLGGAGVWDVFVPAPKSLDNAFLDQIRQLEARLRNEVRSTPSDGQPVEQLTKVVSLVDMIDAGNDALAFFKVAPLSLKLWHLRRTVPPLYRTLHAADPEQPGQYYYRIMLRAKEQQTTQSKQQLIQQVRQISAEEFGPPAQVTGFFVLLSALVESLLGDQWSTFLVATGGIGLVLWLVLRHGGMALVALVPNALPVFVVLGLMGHLGFKINMGTVMIAAVSMGLSVDSSLHYLADLNRAMKRGLNFAQASQEVHQQVGRALLLSTLALAAGFMVLCLSHFIPTIYFGLLVSLSMLGGLLGNLILLPLLLKPLFPAGPPVTPVAAPAVDTPP